MLKQVNYSMSFSALNFPVSYVFNIQTIDGKKVVLDSLRRKYVRLTPEEWVRQNFVQYLIQELGFPKGRTAIETGFLFQGMQCRADVLVHDGQGNPLLMAECKAPGVKIDQSTFDQIGRYNTAVKASCLVVTNGISHYCCVVDRKEKTTRFLNELPLYNQL